MPELSPDERQSKFLEIFKSFDKIGDGIKYIAKVTGYSAVTVSVWRCKSRSGYKIPLRAFRILMDAVQKDPPPKI